MNKISKNCYVDCVNDPACNVKLPSKSKVYNFFIDLRFKNWTKEIQTKKDEIIRDVEIMTKAYRHESPGQFFVYYENYLYYNMFWKLYPNMYN